MDKKRILIEQALDGTLSDKDQLEFQSLLASDPDFAAIVQTRTKLGTYLKENPSDSFSPFFVDKLIKNLPSGEKKLSSDSLLHSLLWSFKRVAFASAFVVLALISFNALNSNDSSQSLVEMAFDIPAVTFDAAQDDFGLIDP